MIGEPIANDPPATWRDALHCLALASIPLALAALFMLCLHADGIDSVRWEPGGYRPQGFLFGLYP